MYFLLFQSLELQKIFLIVRFFNWISCNKGWKAKISCFFLCFFCLTPLPPHALECSRIRKTALLLMSHRPKKYKNQHPQSFMNGAKNIVNVENCQYLKGNYKFLSVIWVEWKQSVCSITLLYSSTLCSLFLPFFVLEIFRFKYDPRYGNTGLVSSGASLTSWGESASLALVGHPSNDGCPTSFAPHLFLLGWLKMNLALLLNQLRLASGDECWW